MSQPEKERPPVDAGRVDPLVRRGWKKVSSVYQVWERVIDPLLAMRVMQVEGAYVADVLTTFREVPCGRFATLHEACVESESRAVTMLGTALLVMR